MSNRTLRERIVQALATYRRGDSTLADLRSAVVVNGRSMEAMPYVLVKEIDDMEYLLTVAQWTDEEGCAPDMESVLTKLDSWLNSVPVEV